MNDLPAQDTRDQAKAARPAPTTIPAIDVSRLTVEAQPVARAAAEVYLRHTTPWFVGLVAHGSALKGGIIPGCSDVDLQLYLTPAAFSEDGALPLSLGIAIQRELARIPLGPFQYIQGFAWPSRLPDGFVGPIPGAYAVVAGRLPMPEATVDDVLAAARKALDALNPLPPSLPAGLLDFGQRRLEGRVRYLCTDVWPLLYQTLTMRAADDPLAVWRLPKPEAIALLPAETAPGRAIRAFYDAVWAYYAPGAATGQVGTTEQALTILERGVAFRQAVMEWWLAFRDIAPAQSPA